MRNKSSERETEREFIYLDWEQVNLSVNSSQNISAMLDTTFIEVSQQRCCKSSDGDEYQMSTGIKLHEHPIDPFKCHIESKKQTDVTRKRTRNQKSIEQKEDTQAND